jgi:protein TonB
MLCQRNIRARAKTALLLAVVIAASGQNTYSAKDRGVRPPKPVYHPYPAYTQAARQRGVEGTVVLDIVIAADGSVSDVVVTKGIDADLDASAVNTVRKWRFEPATKAGKPVAFRTEIEISFRFA